MVALDPFLKSLVQQGGSDLHMASGLQPVMRIHGEMVRVKYKELVHEELKQMLFKLIDEAKKKVCEATGDLDFAYEIEGIARFRVNFFMQKRGIASVFRQIPSKVQTADELGLPPVCKELALLEKGLVLVTGPTGSGKSTTLAAIIDYANKNRKDHIITIEDPIEFVHQSQGCVVNHREVGPHTKSFSAALREDPDIIMVGELRDLETISLALEAAATAHLVFGTLHTQSATKTVDRIINVFSADEQAQIRTTLSEALKAVVAQTLFKRIDKPGRIPALEVMLCTSAVANLIREGKTFQLSTAIQTSRNIGMQSLDDAIMDLLKKNVISSDDAYRKSIDKTKFKPFLKGQPSVLE